MEREERLRKQRNREALEDILRGDMVNEILEFADKVADSDDLENACICLIKMGLEANKLKYRSNECITNLWRLEHG